MAVEFHVAKPPSPWLSLDLAHYHEWVFPDGTRWARFYRIDGGYLLRFPELVDFEISTDGKLVSSWPVPGISKDTLWHIYLNQVLPLALERQGKCVFHASAIDSPTGALVFLGESGRGKSTLAASFALSGHPFLTDDALVLEVRGDDYFVEPSHPSIRLWEDSKNRLVGENAATAPPVQYSSKARLLSGNALAFCSEARPLRCMYFLGTGGAENVNIKPMTPSEATIGLVSNSFLLDIEARDSLSIHFDQVVKFAELPICFQLDYPRSFEVMAEVRAVILEHAENCG